MLPTLDEIRTKAREVMSRKEAAEYLGVSMSTLANWACTKKYHITYFRVGRQVKYRKIDLDKFMETTGLISCTHVRARALVNSSSKEKHKD